MFLREADHYDNFNCHALGIAKVVVGTSENMEEQDYDAIVMPVILSLNEYLVCIIIALIMGHCFLILGIKIFRGIVYSLLKNMAIPNDDINKIATILNLNENLFYLIISLKLKLKTEPELCSY